MNIFKTPCTNRLSTRLSKTGNATLYGCLMKKHARKLEQEVRALKNAVAGYAARDVAGIWVTTEKYARLCRMIEILSKGHCVAELEQFTDDQLQEIYAPSRAHARKPKQKKQLDQSHRSKRERSERLSPA